MAFLLITLCLYLNIIPFLDVCISFFLFLSIHFVGYLFLSIKSTCTIYVLCIIFNVIALSISISYSNSIYFLIIIVVTVITVMTVDIHHQLRDLLIEQRHQ